jgi:serine/threonine-protein kinase
MKAARLPLILLALLWSAFAAYVWGTATQLPERVATHFGASGQPNGWMTRAGHVQFTLIFGLIVPAFVVGIFAAMRFFGDRWLNIPRKDYWLAPERRQETYDFILRQGFWFAGMFIAFLAAIHHSIITANTRSPVTLPGSDVGWIAGPYLVATFVWVAIFIGRFLRKSV